MKYISVYIFLFVLTACAVKNQDFTFKDSDLDGLNDNKDACPNEAGSVFNLGCPESEKLATNLDKRLSTDNDLDGVPNDKDECPDVYGSPFNLGCPFMMMNKKPE